MWWMARGYVTAYAYDALGNQIRSTQLYTAYTTTGDLVLATMATWAAGHTNASDRIIRSAYDADGRVSYVVDGMGYVTALQL
jgi:YD repeat-containing protein